MLKPIKKTIELGDGRTITIETGKLAKQADGAVEVRMGNTMLLATVCSAKEANEGVDFMPLTVEYKEKYASIGRYPGGFLKREGRSSDYEILTSRLVDRVLRPLFPDNYHAETFVNVTLYSADENDAPDALAGLAASAALACSDIPFHGPISEVRVARVDGEWVINPTFAQMDRADIELMVGATYDNIMMVEGEMDEVSEADLLQALKSYPLKTRERITFEYLLLGGVNDGLEQARQLARVVSDVKGKLNLIVYNPSEGDPYKAPSPERVLAFEQYLWDRNITAIIRKSKGQDIKAACGQLKAARQNEAGEEA
mgnify:CR=1 FL=1